jgi:hypothetical protein
MKIVNFILNFFINNHLSKLDINADGVGLILVLALIYTGLLLIYGLIIRKFSILYALLQLIYCVLNSITILLICGLLTYLLGNIGLIIFIISFICIFFVLVLESENMYVINAGKLPGWICDNYEAKQKFYKNLNNDYKKFKQYNEEII